MIMHLRNSAIRYAVVLGLGFSAAAPAQTVGMTDQSAPVIQNDNDGSDDSIRSAVDGPEDSGAVYEAVGQGTASYYGNELAGHRTASGEPFDPAALTAAHRTLPIGSRLRVTNLANGMSVVVRVNDRGPGSRSRILDMSRAAAKQIAMIRSGTATVKLELVRYG